MDLIELAQQNIGIIAIIILSLIISVRIYLKLNMPQKVFSAMATMDTNEFIKFTLKSHFTIMKVIFIARAKRYIMIIPLFLFFGWLVEQAGFETFIIFMFAILLTKDNSDVIKTIQKLEKFYFPRFRQMEVKLDETKKQVFLSTQKP